MLIKLRMYRQTYVICLCTRNYVNIDISKELSTYHVLHEAAMIIVKLKTEIVIVRNVILFAVAVSTIKFIFVRIKRKKKIQYIALIHNCVKIKIRQSSFFSHKKNLFLIIKTLLPKCCRWMASSFIFSIIIYTCNLM